MTNLRRWSGDLIIPIAYKSVMIRKSDIPTEKQNYYMLLPNCWQKKKRRFSGEDLFYVIDEALYLSEWDDFNWNIVASGSIIN